MFQLRTAAVLALTVAIAPAAFAQTTATTPAEQPETETPEEVLAEQGLDHPDTAVGEAEAVAGSDSGEAPEADGQPEEGADAGEAVEVAADDESSGGGA